MIWHKHKIHNWSCVKNDMKSMSKFYITLFCTFLFIDNTQLASRIIIGPIQFCFNIHITQ